MERELRRKDEKIFELENQVFFFRAQVQSQVQRHQLQYLIFGNKFNDLVKSPATNKENEDPETIEEIHKKRKVDKDVLSYYPCFSKHLLRYM